MEQCTLKGVEALQQIAKETFYETYEKQIPSEIMHDYLEKSFHIDQLKNELMNPFSQFFLLYYKKDIAGYLKINEYDAQTIYKANDMLEIERIYIHKCHQQTGLGKYLINKAIHIAIEKQKEMIWLGVWEKNELAISFYNKLGFKKVGTHSFFMGDKQLTDYTMMKSLHERG